MLCVSYRPTKLASEYLGAADGRSERGSYGGSFYGGSVGDPFMVSECSSNASSDDEGSFADSFEVSNEGSFWRTDDDNSRGVQC